MTEREKFEQATAEISRKDGYSEKAISRILRKNEQGEYVLPTTAIAYVYWQAAIKSAIPDGYVLVPKASASMIEAGAGAAGEDMWEEMLDTAQRLETDSD